MPVNFSQRLRKLAQDFNAYPQSFMPGAYEDVYGSEQPAVDSLPTAVYVNQRIQDLEGPQSYADPRELEAIARSRVTDLEWAKDAASKKEVPWGPLKGYKSQKPDEGAINWLLQNAISDPKARASIQEARGNMDPEFVKQKQIEDTFSKKLSQSREAPAQEKGRGMNFSQQADAEYEQLLDERFAGNEDALSPAQKEALYREAAASVRPSLARSVGPAAPKSSVPEEEATTTPETWTAHERSRARAGEKAMAKAEAPKAQAKNTLSAPMNGLNPQMIKDLLTGNTPAPAAKAPAPAAKVPVNDKLSFSMRGLNPQMIKDMLVGNTNAPARSSGADDSWSRAVRNFKGMQDKGGFGTLSNAIAARNQAGKGTAQYNQVQNLINKAYGVDRMRPVEKPVAAAKAAPVKSAPAAPTMPRTETTRKPDMTPGFRDDKTASFNADAFIAAKIKGQQGKYIANMNKTAAMSPVAKKKLLKSLGLLGVAGLGGGAAASFKSMENPEQEKWERGNEGLGFSGPYAEAEYKMLDAFNKKMPGWSSADPKMKSLQGDALNRLNSVGHPGGLSPAWESVMRDIRETTADPSSPDLEEVMGEPAGVWNPDIEDIRALMLSKNKPYITKTEAFNADAFIAAKIKGQQGKYIANMNKTAGFDVDAFIAAKIKGQQGKYIANMNKTAAMDSDKLIENRIKGKGFRNYASLDQETKKDACIKRGMEKDMNLLKKGDIGATLYPSREMGRITTGNQSKKTSALDESMQEQIRNLILENPGMEDELLHSLATEMGVEPDEAEEFVYSELQKHLAEDTPQGEANAGEDYSKFAWLKIAEEQETVEVSPKQVIEGTKVESKEHHGPAEVSTKIALDHLMETQDYYDKLPDVEEKGTPTRSDQKSGMGQLFGDMKYIPPTPEKGEERKKEFEKKEAAQVTDTNPADQKSTAYYKNSPMSSDASNVGRLINGMSQA